MADGILDILQVLFIVIIGIAVSGCLVSVLQKPWSRHRA